MICGRGVDEWHGIPLFAIIHPCPAERVSVVSVVDGPSVRLIFSLAFLTGAPSARAEHQQLGPPGTNGPCTFCLHPKISIPGSSSRVVMPIFAEETGGVSLCALRANVAVYCALRRFWTGGHRVGTSPEKQKIPVCSSRTRGIPLSRVGGRGGIRTPGRLAPTQPFQGCTIDHSDTLPGGKSGDSIQFSFSHGNRNLW